MIRPDDERLLVRIVRRANRNLVHANLGLLALVLGVIVAGRAGLIGTWHGPWPHEPTHRAALAAATLLAVWNLRKGYLRSLTPSTHPSMRRLARHGDVGEVATAIEADVTLGLDERWAVGRRWMVFIAPSGFIVVELQEVVGVRNDWIPTVFGPALSYVRILLKNGRRKTLLLFRSDIGPLLDEIQASAPHIPHE